MNLVALAVLIVMLAISAWAWRRAPGRIAADQFVGIWRVTPWGKQFYFDFFGLQTVLVLWMLTDTLTRGTWLLFALCTVTMPLFGAMSAAAYWLLRA